MMIVERMKREKISYESAKRLLQSTTPGSQDVV